MITIQKSETANTRTCDWSKVDKETLKRSSELHIMDVKQGMVMFANRLVRAASDHDFDKLSDEGLSHFHECFQTGFEDMSWFLDHLQLSRHHIDKPEGRRQDINLVDVIEHVVDCVMAGMARSGDIYPIELPNEVLQLAVKNSVDLLKGQVEVVEPARPDWQQRVINELDELQDKIARLSAALDRGVGTENGGSNKLLWDQLAQMRGYRDILQRRIVAFDELDKERGRG